MTDINAWASELLGKEKTLMDGTYISAFKSMLQHDVVAIEYLKKDKTKTTIVCTLNKVHIPQNVQSAIPPHQTPSDTSITVWSVDRGGWRRLSFDSIISVKLSSKTFTPKNNGEGDSIVEVPATVHTLSTKLSKMQAKELSKWLQKMADSQKEALIITIEQCLNTGMLISITNNTTKQTLEL